MASGSMTGSFYLTETVIIPAASASGTRVQGTIDLGAYVNVPTGQACSIEQVDWVWQVGADFGNDLSTFLAAGQNGAVSAQLSDLNPGTSFIRADDQSLVASGALNIDQVNNIGTHTADLYPDDYGSGKGAEDTFIVVNDTLYVVAGNDAATIGVADLYVSVRIKMRVIKLSQKQWIALGIQSTASDN